MGSRTMDRIEDHELFTCIIDHRSFVKASEHLRISPSAVSRQLQKIEKTLGVTLLHRTTRSLSLTEEGKLFYESCRRIDEEKRNIRHRLLDLKAKPAGHLKLTATPAFAYAQLVDAMAAFQDEYPDIHVELEVSDKQLDLVEEGIDLAIRIGKLQDSRLKCRRLLRSRLIPCASPAYLARYGEPEQLADLKQHRLVSINHLPQIEKRQQLLLADIGIENKDISLKVNDVLSLYRAVLAGMGISFLPHYLIQADLEAQQLVELLPQQARMLHEVYVLFVQSEYMPVKTRVFLDFLQNYFQ